MINGVNQSVRNKITLGHLKPEYSNLLILFKV